METVRIDDANSDAAEIDVTIYNGEKFVFIDFDPDVEIPPVTIMQYTPSQARELAAVLILAAEEAEKQ